MVNKGEVMKEENFEVNWNPFTSGGILSRLQYLGIGVANALMFQIPMELLLREMQANPDQTWPFISLLALLPIVIYVGIINVIKRVRDIKGKQFRSADGWQWSIGSVVPLINIIVGIRLLFEVGRISSNLAQDE